MCEVTNKNFEDVYPEIIQDLQSATFVAVDCEFSGLFVYDNNCSLFDTPSERFSKLQKSLEEFIIIQFGLSTFEYKRSSNTFSVSSYTFYLKPSAVLGSQTFTCESGSIDFLCEHNFNFNKLFYDGINYLNKFNEDTKLKMIKDGNLISKAYADNIQKYCSVIAEWNGSAPEGCEMSLELNKENKTLIYLLHKEIRKRFPNIWTFFENESNIKIKKVNDLEKKTLLLNRQENSSLKKKLYDSMLGFSRVIKEIEKLKKPIIGHHFLNDLIMIYKQFYNPTPVSYKKFKKDISQIFPNIYDTKTISFKLRELLPRDKTWNSNSLPELYNWMKNGKGATVVIFTPLMSFKQKEFYKTEKFHDAGFDSYCTGFCFIKMAHMFSLWDEQKKSFLCTAMPTSSSWLLGAVASMKNQINITRGQVNHIVLDGEDPISNRPGFLYIQSKSSQPLDISKISEAIAKYASVDIQLLSKYNGLMAVGNKKQVKEILNYFKNHKEYTVTKYNFLIDSHLGRTVLSLTVIGTILLAGICAFKGWIKL